MKNKIIYGGMLLFIFSLTLLYDLQSMRFLLCFLLLLPLVLEVWLVIMKKKVKIQFDAEDQVVFLQDPYSVSLWIHNGGTFPLSRVVAKLQVRETISQSSWKSRRNLMADGRERKHSSQNCIATHCGHYVWTVTEIRIYDYLGIFYRKLNEIQETQEIQVFPPIQELTLRYTREGTDQEMEEEYEENRPGDDVSQVFQIRPYQGGDAVSRIHWKMTAKEEELMVKDYARPKGSPILLVLDLASHQPILPGCLDDFLELAASISSSLIHQELSHQVMWYKENQVERRYISREEDVYELLSGLVHTSLKTSDETDGGIMRLVQGESRGRTLYRLDRTLHLYKGEFLCMDFGTVDKQEWEKQWIQL